MKPYAAVLMLGAGMLAPSARAALILDITDPIQTVAPGQSYTFHGTIVNTETSSLYLSGGGLQSFDVNLDPDILTKLSEGVQMPVFVLSPGETYSGLIFGFTPPLDTPPGTYTYAVERNAYSQEITGYYVESNSVLVQVTVVPEPTTWLLACVALGILGFATRLRC